MKRPKKLTLSVVIFSAIALMVAGAASAAAGIVGGDADDTTPSTEAPPPGGSQDEPSPTDTTLPSEGAVPDPDEGSEGDEGGDEGTFGQIISALRQAGDHTPAAIIMGKEVPGWDPEKHPGSTTDTTAYPPGQLDKDRGNGDGDDGTTVDEDGDDGDADQESGDVGGGTGKDKPKKNDPPGQSK